MTASLPLVSLVMPTRGRPNLSLESLLCALQQDYPQDRTEILIFDDDDNPSFSHPPASGIERVHYYRSSPFPSLGAKRNAMCESASGDIIIHFDSDDLSSPGRVSTQVRHLLSSGKSICGFHTLPFYDLCSSPPRSYLYHLNPVYVCGASLCYTRDFRRDHPFLNTDTGEDTPFTVDRRENRTSLDGRELLVALLHENNISSRDQIRRHPDIFPEMDLRLLPDWFHDRLTKMMTMTPSVW